MATMLTKMSPDDIREAIKKAETVLAESNSIKTLSQTARVLVDTLARVDAFYTDDLCAERADVVSTLNRLQAAGADPEPCGWLAATLRYIAKDYDGYIKLIKPVVKKLLAGDGTIGFEEAEDKFLRVFNYINVDDRKNTFFKKFHEILPQKCQDSAFGLYVSQKASRATTFNGCQKNLQNVIDADSKWVVAYKDIGDLCCVHEKWWAAADYFEIAVGKSDTYKSADVYSKLGMACFNSQQWDKSEKAYRRSLELGEQDPTVNNQLGLCLFKQKKYAESIEWFDRCIEQGTDVASPYHCKFDALEKLGRTEDLLDFVKSNPSYFCEKEKYRKKIIEMDGGMEVILDGEGEDGIITESKNAGSFVVSQSNSAIRLYPHQNDAIREMKSKITGAADSFAGILVLPTGGGKTLTATYWLMRDILDKGGKLIWLAHRHELLNQARDSFKKVCYSDITGNKTSYNWRLVSGQHDRPVNIKTTDDIIIASKTSLYRGGKYLDKWLKANGSNVFLVIDEAHHAAASEYRKLIENIKKSAKNHFKMLGLTATPFRTAEKEHGLLGHIFSDNIVYKIDLGELISREILSKPEFRSVDTKVDMKDLFNKHNAADALSRIVNESFFDINAIGPEIAQAIADNGQRNNAIVDEYVKNSDTYKQTLVFALNVPVAFALTKVFKNAGVKADYVVSSIKDKYTGVTVSDAKNERKIDSFRKGKLDVLINVNILTEGVDLPQAQSVFLTRPTKSTILMTQMIGRALRGEKAGGTKEAYIVSFIDDWREHIAWVNPQQIFIGTNVPPIDNNKQTRESVRRLISIAKIEEFAQIVADTLPPELNLQWIDRMPVGIYQFKYLTKADDDNDDDEEKDINILVFDCTQKAYEEFLAWLRLQNKTITDVEEVANHIDTTQFGTATTGRLLGYRKQDIIDIINYYNETREVPKMIEFAERDQYDISVIAKDIVDRNLGPSEQHNLIDSEWKRSDNHWSAFFGISNRIAFRKAIEDEIQRILDPGAFSVAETPLTVKEQIKIQDLTVYEIKQRFPEIGEKLIADVYAKFTDKDGYYYSAQSGYRSKCKLDFQIDHIKPMSKGGKTVFDNLQLLTCEENWIKSDR